MTPPESDVEAVARAIDEASWAEAPMMRGELMAMAHAAIEADPGRKAMEEALQSLAGDPGLSVRIRHRARAALVRARGEKP